MSSTTIIIVALLLTLIFLSFKLVRTQTAKSVGSQSDSLSSEDAVYENIFSRASV